MYHAPIAYVYEADYHCPACTALRFPPCDPFKQPACCDQVDSEGNEVHPVFSWEQHEDIYCGDCLEQIDY